MKLLKHRIHFFKETNAVHMTIGAGSYLEITIPWTVKPDGYATKISGQLLHVDASTSLQVFTNFVLNLNVTYS